MTVVKNICREIISNEYILRIFVAFGRVLVYVHFNS
jgi:hypothetical protein